MTTKERERLEAITQLKEWIKPGDTVYTILDHVSSSGMTRHIRVLVPTITQNGSQHVDFIHPNHSVSKALGIRRAKKGDGLVIGGCGMDMGFHLVNSLSYALYGDGYQCLGKGKCPSNYHSNHRDTIRCEGTRIYNPDGPDTGHYCYKPDLWGRFKTDDAELVDWPRLAPINLGDGAKIEGPYASCVEENGKHIICPTCKGIGSLPNPEGPERFDLVHTDGYALRHKWL